MAEFCIDCWNEINGFEDSEEEYLMSKTLCLCEGCGEYKNVVIVKKKDADLGIYLAYGMHIIGLGIFVIFEPLLKKVRRYRYLKRRQKRRKAQNARESKK